MNKVASTIITGIVTFFVSLSLNAALGYWLDNQGMIDVSNPIFLNNAKYRLIEIENYSTSIINGLIIQVPFETKISEITSSPVTKLTSTIEDIRADIRTIKIDQILPRHITRIAIPLVGNGIFDDVRVLNADAHRLTIKTDGNIESELHKAIISGAITAVIYALCFMAFTYYHYTRSAEIEKKNEATIKKLERIEEKEQEQIKSLEDKLNKADAIRLKMQILLLGRIQDYSTELLFWRNAIKELLIKTSGEAGAADNLIRSVTDYLKTYGTKSHAPDFNAVVVAASWLNEYEKGKANTNSPP